MTTWHDLRARIAEGDVPAVTSMIAAFGAAERRATAERLPGLLKELLAKTKYGFLHHEVDPLLVAGAGTIGGAAAAAAWLCRTDLRPSWSDDGHARLRASLAEVTAWRPDGWHGDVARRVAARIRVDAGVWRAQPLWDVAAALTLAGGAAPPTADAFVVGWVARPTNARALAADPFLDALVPHLFEAEGLGAALAHDAAAAKKGGEATWAVSLSALAASGRLDRRLLLDGCVSRFLRGGTAAELRWFTVLHDLLAPTLDETAPRVRDYVRLLPSAPPAVAELALDEVRRADDAEPLDAALFDDAAAALLFRAEKKLVRAGLTWLDRTARKRGRVDATLRALPAVFPSDALDLRERAVRSAVKHAGRADEATRETVRAAAADLPAELRLAIAEVFGPVDAAEAPPAAGPPPFVPRELLPPPGSPANLAGELAEYLNADRTWDGTERLLAGLVHCAFRDPAATREATGPVMAEMYWSPAYEDWFDSSDSAHVWVPLAVRSLIAPKRGARLHSALSAYLRARTWRSGETSTPLMQRFLTWRMREAASMIGTVPVLLATPTEGGGQIDPGVLVARLETLEETGTEPGRADLAQALLRVPREIDPAAVARAGALRSKAGRTVAAWLAAGGLADPTVECRFTPPPKARHDQCARLTVTPPEGIPSDIARLCSVRESDPAPNDYHGPIDWWPVMLPSHREVAAAHLLPHLTDNTDYPWRQGSVALALAEADGPAGRATGALLACALANRGAGERSLAVDALLALAGRGHLPSEDLGATAGELAARGNLKLNRIVATFTAAADAGAHAEVWTAIAAALPHVLPAPGARPLSGLPDLVALGTRTAETTGARTTVPAVRTLAERGGTSRLAKEVTRLQRVLTSS